MRSTFEALMAGVIFAVMLYLIAVAVVLADHVVPWWVLSGLVVILGLFFALIERTTDG